MSQSAADRDYRAQVILEQLLGTPYDENMAEQDVAEALKQLYDLCVAALPYREQVGGDRDALTEYSQGAYDYWRKSIDQSKEALSKVFGVKD